MSSDLRYVDLPYLTDEECRDIYGEDAVMIDMMCAGFLGGQGVCNVGALGSQQSVLCVLNIP